MGFDAYRLIPMITNSQEVPQATIPGLTGDLELRDGRVFRHLVWAQFNGGVPELLPPPAEVVDDETILEIETEPSP